MSIQQEIDKLEKAIVAQESLRGTLTNEEVDAAIARLRQKQKELNAQLPETPGTSYKAKVKGAGVIAQGPGSTAIGAGGVSVGGNVGGSVVTGDGNTVIGGDQVQGDKVQGDKIAGDKISVDNITDSNAIAIGRGAQAQQGVS
ncbi:MAG: hypothetical protein GY952_05195 [Rhodobacteraceae bacterium]|nr:hypothetical protein [Paracoccaceae bacterium]